MLGVFWSCYFAIFTGKWISYTPVYTGVHKVVDYFLMGDGTDVGFFGWLGQVISHSTSTPQDFWGNLLTYTTSIVTGLNTDGVYSTSLTTSHWYFIVSGILAFLSCIGVVVVMYKLLKWAITSWVYKFR